MRVVLDAGAAVQIALNPNPPPAHREAIAEADSVLAPELIVAEIETCQQVLESALNLIDTLVSGRDLYREAFLLARTSRLPAYDMFYLALARRDDARLLTADRVLRKQAANQGVRVI